jgi:hypothetical protein
MDDVGRYDFTCVQGSGWRMHFTFEQPDGSGGFAPVDLFGCQIHMDIRPQYADDDPSPAPVASATVTVTDASGGEFTASLDSGDTAGLNGTYVYDLDLVESGVAAFRHTLARGAFTFEPEVTR